MLLEGIMKNVSNVSAEWLNKAGIDTLDELREIGVIPVYYLIKRFETSVSLNLLWALEGAVKDIDYREISAERKEELKIELEMFKKSNPDWFE